MKEERLSTFRGQLLSVAPSGRASSNDYDRSKINSTNVLLLKHNGVYLNLNMDVLRLGRSKLSHIVSLSNLRYTMPTNRDTSHRDNDFTNLILTIPMVKSQLKRDRAVLVRRSRTTGNYTRNYFTRRLNGISHRISRELGRNLEVGFSRVETCLSNATVGVNRFVNERNHMKYQRRQTLVYGFRDKGTPFTRILHPRAKAGLPRL